MSHFTVTVRVPSDVPIQEVTQHVDRLLAPYQENNMGDCPEQYMEFHDMGEEYRPAYDSGEETMRQFKDPDGNYHSPYNNEWAVKGDGPLGRTTYVPPEGWEDVEAPANEVFASFDEYMTEYHEVEKNDDGQFGYMHNPNCKWDWWVVGGRWRGYYPISEEALNDSEPRYITGESGVFGNAPEERTADGARIEDIDMLTIETQLDQLTEQFWQQATTFVETGENSSPFYGVRPTLMSLGFVRCLNDDEITDEERETHMLKKWDRQLIEGTDRYDVIDKSILQRKKELRGKVRAQLHPLRTFSALDPNEGWLEAGEMGWFGASTDTPESAEDYGQKFLEWFLGGDQRDWVVVVDCHI